MSTNRCPFYIHPWPGSRSVICRSNSMQCNSIQELIINHLLFAKNCTHIWGYKDFWHLVFVLEDSVPWESQARRKGTLIHWDYISWRHMEDMRQVRNKKANYSSDYWWTWLLYMCVCGRRHSSVSGRRRHYFKGNAVGIHCISKQMNSKVEASFHEKSAIWDNPMASRIEILLSWQVSLYIKG